MKLLDHIHAFCHRTDIRVCLDLVEHAIFCARPVQLLGDITHLPAGGHKAVCDNKDLVELWGQSLQPAALHDFGAYAEGVHISRSLSCSVLLHFHAVLRQTKNALNVLSFRTLPRIRSHRDIPY